MFNIYMYWERNSLNRFITWTDPRSKNYSISTLRMVYRLLLIRCDEIIYMTILQNSLQKDIKFCRQSHVIFLLQTPTIIFLFWVFIPPLLRSHWSHFASKIIYGMVWGGLFYGLTYYLCNLMCNALHEGGHKKVHLIVCCLWVKHICVRHYAGQKILGVSVAQPITCHHYKGECVLEALEVENWWIRRTECRKGIPGSLVPLPGSSLGL